ncbi:hypothetical protein [Natranaerofaba carboxydovora]|nr:hypothetical protein [Natranaerofaba carboxydovora]
MKVKGIVILMSLFIVIFIVGCEVDEKTQAESMAVEFSAELLDMIWNLVI